MALSPITNIFSISKVFDKTKGDHDANGAENESGAGADTDTMPADSRVKGGSEEKAPEAKVHDLKAYKISEENRKAFEDLIKKAGLDKELEEIRSLNVKNILARESLERHSELQKFRDEPDRELGQEKGLKEPEGKWVSRVRSQSVGVERAGSFVEMIGKERSQRSIDDSQIGITQPSKEFSWRKFISEGESGKQPEIGLRR